MDNSRRGSDSEDGEADRVLSIRWESCQRCFPLETRQEEQDGLCEHQVADILQKGRLFYDEVFLLTLAVS